MSALRSFPLLGVLAGRWDCQSVDEENDAYHEDISTEYSTNGAERSNIRTVCISNTYVCLLNNSAFISNTYVLVLNGVVCSTNRIVCGLGTTEHVLNRRLRCLVLPNSISERGVRTAKETYRSGYCVTFRLISLKSRSIAASGSSIIMPSLILLT